MNKIPYSKTMEIDKFFQNIESQTKEEIRKKILDHRKNEQVHKEIGFCEKCWEKSKNKTVISRFENRKCSTCGNSEMGFIDINDVATAPVMGEVAIQRKQLDKRTKEVFSTLGAEDVHEYQNSVAVFCLPEAFITFKNDGEKIEFQKAAAKYLKDKKKTELSPTLATIIPTTDDGADDDTTDDGVDDDTTDDGVDDDMPDDGADDDTTDDDDEGEDEEPLLVITGSSEGQNVVNIEINVSQATIEKLEHLEESEVNWEHIINAAFGEQTEQLASFTKDAAVLSAASEMGLRKISEIFSVQFDDTLNDVDRKKLESLREDIMNIYTESWPREEEE